MEIYRCYKIILRPFIPDLIQLGLLQCICKFNLVIVADGDHPDHRAVLLLRQFTDLLLCCILGSVNDELFPYIALSAFTDYIRISEGLEGCLCLLLLLHGTDHKEGTDCDAHKKYTQQ